MDTGTIIQACQSLRLKTDKPGRMAIPQGTMTLHNRNRNLALVDRLICAEDSARYTS
jgi:hypothetical protein